MTGRDGIKLAEKRLRGAGIDDPSFEASAILAFLHKTTISESFLINNISDEEIFFRLVELRSNGKPLQLIFGKWEFFGREFLISEGVFIPRPETEGLVEIVLAKIPKNKKSIGLEVGVGSGAICCSLLFERPDLKMVGTDISEKAIELARENAELLDVSENLFLYKINIAEGIEEKFDFVVSNPPYILPEEMESLPREVKHDPYDALCGGIEGLEITTEIIEAAKRLLLPAGFIALEIHEEKGNRVNEILKKSFNEVAIEKDLSGKDRYALGFNRKE